MGMESDNTSVAANARMVRRFFWNRRAAARMTADAVGMGLAILGGILAFIAVFDLLFVPATVVTVFENEVIALIGAIAFVAGIVVHALADSW